MNIITKTLLGGVALCALAATPAAANNAPSIHLAVSKSSSAALHFRGSSVAHFKTNAGSAPATDFTETATFSGALTAGDLNQTVVLLGETWYDSSNCTQPTKKQSWKKAKASPKAGKLSTSTSTGSIGGCTGVPFTFQDLDFDWTKKHDKSTVVTASLIAKNFDKYNLTLNAIIDLSL